MGLLGGTREDTARSTSRREHSVWTRLLAPGEQVQEVFRLPRTTFIFTGRRLILVEEALTGRKVEYQSLPDRSITHFSVDASASFAADADLKIWLAGRAAPIEKGFGANVDIYAVQAVLAQHLPS